MSDYYELAQALGGSITPKGLKELGAKIEANPSDFEAEIVGEYYQFLDLAKKMFAEPE